MRGRRQNIVGRKVFEFSPARQADGRSSPEAGRELFARMAQADRLSFEWVHRRCDGEAFHCLATCVTTQIDAQRVILAGWRDITARKQSEEALRNSQLQLNTALLVARAGAWTYDVEADEFTFNDNIYRIFRTTVQEVGSHRLGAADYTRQFVHPDDAAVVTEEICLALQTTDPDFTRELEHRILFRDGGTGWLAVRYGVVKDPAGRTVRMYGVNQDITERKAAQAALLEGEQRFRLLVDGVRDYAIYQLDPQGQVVTWNAGAERLLGHSANQAAGLTWSGFFGESDRSQGRPEEVLALVRRHGRHEETGWRRRRDGSQFWCQALITALRDEQGGLRGFAEVARNITELREAEQARQAHLRTLECLDSMHVAIQQTGDPEEMPRRVIEAVMAMFPCDGATLIHPCEPGGDSWSVVVDRCGTVCLAAPGCGTALPVEADVRELFESAAAERRTVLQCGPGAKCPLPETFGRLFGAKGAMLMRLTPVGGSAWILMIRQCGRARAWSSDEERIFLEVGSRLEDGLSSLLLFRQIRELNGSLEARVKDRTAELDLSNRELRRSNGDLERFAYAASHDLKSPLKAVASLAGWLEEDLGESVSPESRKHFDLLRQRVGRMERLLDDLLLYSRAGRVREAVGEIAVAELFADAVGLVNVPPGFTVTLAPGSLDRVTTAITPVRTILTNLVSNAIKHHDRQAGTVVVSVEEVAGEYRFAVADDGPGIPPEFRERIWDMFQTLRPRDQVEGSGMGLAMVRRLTVFYGGSAEVERREPRGSTFRVALPKAIAESQPPAADE